MKTIFYNRGQTLTGIIIVLVIVGVIGGGLYLYLSKQIPGIPEVAEKVGEEQGAPAEKVVEPEEEIIPSPKEELPGKETTVPEETTPEEEITPTCQNECSQVGLKKCSGNGYQTCGNYDTDNCLEWSSVIACAANTICQNGSCIQQKGSVVLVVDESTYNALSNEIATFKSDIESDSNLDVSVLHRNWAKGSEIRSELVKLFQNEGLQGAILIGDIPIMYHTTKYQGQVYPASPSDYYYQKLDTKDWIEETSDTIIQNIDQKYVYSRTIWTGRLMPPGNNSTQKIELLRSYFDRNHKYRVGQLSYDGMLFVDSHDAVSNVQDFNNTVSQIADYTNLYQQSSKVETAYATDASARKSSILGKITKNYEIMSFNVHGTSKSQFIGGSSYINKEDITANPPGSLFIALESCSNGDISDSEYLAGWYLFSGKSLLVKANSDVTFYIGWGDLASLIEYKLIAAGASFGDMYKISTGGQQSILFGDPTLTIRDKNFVNGPKLTALDENTINLGQKNINQVKDDDVLKTIRIKNNGEFTLELSRYSFGYIWLDRSLDEGTSYPSGVIRYGPTIKTVVPPISEISIAPGETKNVYVVVQGKNYIVPGRYRDFYTYITNDPSNFLFRIELNCTWYK